MIPKLAEMEASVERLPENSSAVITNPHALIRELFTHMGEGTVVRKGEEIVHYESLRAVNTREMRELIQSAFGGKLAPDYFRQLTDKAHVFTTPQSYNGVAIVIPDEVQPDEKPAYMDKLAVRSELTGMGIGKELLETASQTYTGGLYWRTKTSNITQKAWYSKVAQAQYEVDEWTVFMVNVRREDIAECISKAATVPTTITY